MQWFHNNNSSRKDPPQSTAQDPSKMTTDGANFQEVPEQQNPRSVPPQSNSTGPFHGISLEKDKVYEIRLKLFPLGNLNGECDEPGTKTVLKSVKAFPPANVDKEYNAEVDFEVSSKKIFPGKETTLKNGESQGGFTLVNDEMDANRGAKNFSAYGLDVEITLKDKGCFDKAPALKLRVSGKPTAEFNGGFRLSIISPGYRSVSNLIPFIINPDPWSLWEDHPHDENAPYSDKPDQASETARTGDSLVLAASCRGRSHAHVGSFRDDEFLVKLAESPEEWSVLAVADGAGSARYSRQGSKLACRAAVAYLTQYLNTEPYREKVEAGLISPLKEKLQDAVNQGQSLYDFSKLAQDSKANTDCWYGAVWSAYTAINNECQKRLEEKLEEKVTFKDYNTTLLLTAFRRLEVDGAAYTLFLSYWVGDGAPAILKPNGLDEVFLLGEVDAGEYAGQTRFLSKDQVDPQVVGSRLRFACVKNFEALVMMTDGVSDPFFNSENDLSDFDAWNNFWTKKELQDAIKKNGAVSDAERAEKLLAWLNFKETGYHDDRTLLILLPHEEETPSVDVEKSSDAQETSQDSAEPSQERQEQEESSLTPCESSAPEDNIESEENPSSEDNDATNSNN